MSCVFSTPCLKHTDTVLSRKPINFCYLPIYPYLYTFPQIQKYYFKIQALLQVSLSMGRV